MSIKDYEFYKNENGVLYKGDCLEIMPLLEDESIDMVCCDLPYGTTACKWDSIIPFEPLWEQYKRLRKDNTAIALTASQPFTTKLADSNLNEFKYEWIWEKNNSTNFLNAKKMPLKKHENILLFYKKQPTYNPQFTEGKPYTKKQGRFRADGGYLGTVGFKLSYSTVNEGFRYPTSILKFNQEKGLHPTQKPVSLFEYLIKTYTNENMTVLDNCSGSGTTAIASENLGRKWICIEQDEGYCEITKKRLIEHEKKSKVFGV